MSAEDIQTVLHELDGWCRRERAGRLGWKRLEAVSGFTRQALSSHPEIAERFGQAKATNRRGGSGLKCRPRGVDQRVIDLQRQVEQLRGIISRYDERWACYARNAALRGIDLAILDEPLEPPARSGTRSFPKPARGGRQIR